MENRVRLDGPRSAYGYKWSNYRAEVYKDVDSKTGDCIATKKIFCDYSKRSGSGDRASGEFLSMMVISHHPNIISLRNGVSRSDALLLSFEYIESNLETMMSTPISPSLRKDYLKQILVGVEYLHSRNIVHRHLESRFVLVDPSNNVKLSEFGEAKGGRSKELASGLPDPNVGYRPPEVIYCASRQISSAVDVWAVGCIFASMVLHRPLFPCTNQRPRDELFAIYSFLGRPDERNWPLFGEAPNQKKLQSCEEKDLSLEPWGIFGIEETGLDLLSKMLKIEPEKRITAQEALKHPYFSETTGDTKMLGKRKFEDVSGDVSVNVKRPKYP